ncbi:MarR family winged helix-turn-helix transcriptional regulator [Chelatococcus sp. SYSU_G07232]|uniref:MarR family winged helix-turn-helix transcriptional regulator n=1 Tax=Chelatococcus albus TaxID=3047466 RepID=A0ABT7AEV0_9HYPH|nr:MarR family winged helix-turn-helix transcriptional regulator [Chelatococcus sp. SYSU_G07232]MDJ1157903.1 MarR family winged helix-turn-helix transcriptional regulator [Chelatococcus sp. SYSU_G07232]
MPTVEDIAKTCACLHTRMTARAVTRVYDEALRPIGLKVTQFSLLGAIAHGVTGSVSALAETLALERTTLTRNLRLLHEAGMIAPQRGAGRAVAYELTAKGRAMIERAIPLWEAAQRRIEAALGTAEWEETRGRLKALRKAARASA